MGMVHIFQNYLFIFHFNEQLYIEKYRSESCNLVEIKHARIAALFAVSCASHAGFFKIDLEREMVKPPLDVLKIWISL